MMNDTPELRPSSGSEVKSEACGPDCDCGPPPPTRRAFLANAALAAGATALGSRQITAGPFRQNERHREVVPADKKLDPAWTRSLYERGTKDTWDDPDALRHIGMPVGGFFAGTVYLGGDGRLWLWDIFNRDQEGIAPREFDGEVPNRKAGDPLLARLTRAGHNYLSPAPPDSPITQGFWIEVDGAKRRSLDLEGFKNVRFDGRYPIGRVSYADPACPVDVNLEAFSPFSPLELDDSSLPAILLTHTVTNRSAKAVEVTIGGFLENAVLHHGRRRATGKLVSEARRGTASVSIESSAAKIERTGERRRPDIVVEDFEKETYEGWTVEGEAFGKGPIAIDEIPDYQGNVGGTGKRVVNSHASAPSEDLGKKDGATGKLTSDAFTIERKFIALRVGGGPHAGRTCVNLLVDGAKVASLPGHSNNRMRKAAFDVRAFEGKKARIEIVDAVSGPWGNIGVDEIVQTDHPQTGESIDELYDFGTMTFALLEKPSDSIEATAHRDSDAPLELAESPLGGPELVGEIRKRVRLEPGESVTVPWSIAWHFPKLHIRGMGTDGLKHSYGARFKSSAGVTKHLTENYARLSGETRSWVETWYDSTLPYWLLDRTMANTSILATTTCYRMEDGRFWAWEGVGCCPGTCTHVWHYAQAPGRLFPELERDHRRRVDFGSAFHRDGGVGHRAGLSGGSHPAIDGQCGRILGCYREHQMSSDDSFLRELWPRIRKAIEWLIAHDSNADGVIEGAQHNTLDAAWYGKIAWITSLYLATLEAGAAMAKEMGDTKFENVCRAIHARGVDGILETYNGEYFTQIEDPTHSGAIGTGTGCHIDQVFGQAWAHWVGLGHVFDREKQLSALRALWKYNFVPDIGPFREKFPRGRWYATAGDAGLVMCTWPQGGESENYAKHWQYGYFNECMTGFEWQAAAHMIWEGIDQPDLLLAGLAVSRAIHDRYDASLRNPYNEVECSDHYSRAMASYGVYQSVCGFQCHGPRGKLRFAPRVSAEDFQAAFVSPDGWGSYAQKLEANSLRVRVTLKKGEVRLRELSLEPPNERFRATRLVTGEIESKLMRSKTGSIVVRFSREQRIQQGQSLEIEIRA